METAWIKELDSRKILHTDNVTMAGFLGEELKI